jgi:UDP-N-acetylmuramate--alanine ligase
MKAHFLGIGGVGMLPLAEIVLARGWEVSGCDLKDSDPLRKLAAKGVEIALTGNDPSHVASHDLLVHTSRLSPAGMREKERAKSAGMRVQTRAELLAGLISHSRTVGVAGSHGKTTTTAMVGHILTEIGWDPSALIGDAFSSRVGAGSTLVAELDESDASLPLHRPEIAIVTNVELDHQDYFQDLEALRRCFDAFLDGLPEGGLPILCADDPWLSQRRGSRRLTYGFAPEADYRCHSGGQIDRGGRPLARLKLRVPGQHNLQNATAALAVAVELGVEPVQAAEALASFAGARRRLERLGAWRGATIYDDYGHHPTEVRVTVEAARELPHRRLLLLFQPHRYSRYMAMREDFLPVFAAADRTLITEIYGAGEENPDSVSSASLAAEASCDFVPTLEDARIWLENEVNEGDLVLLMGAGNIRSLGEKLAQE